MNQIEMDALQVLIHKLPKIEKHLGTIAENTKGKTIDFSLFESSYSDFKKSAINYPPEGVYLFIQGLMLSLATKGSEGVLDYIISHPRRHDILSVLDDDVRSIHWCVEDIEHRADELESSGEKPFDRSCFGKILTKMCYDHDATIGITWDTIDAYLFEYAVIDNEGVSND